MYELSHAGGVPYPETDKYHYDDGSEERKEDTFMREPFILLLTSTIFSLLVAPDLALPSPTPAPVRVASQA